MDTITQIIDSLNKFSASSFIFSQNIGVLSLLNHIPDSISLALNNDDFIFHLNEASKNIDWLSNYLDSNVNKKAKKLLSKHSKNDEQPYADFKVDKLPIFKPRSYQQITIDDILKSHLEDGHPLKPVDHRKDDSIPDGTVCPYCGADKKFLYDNNKKGQFLCKACRNTFTIRTTVSDSIDPCCPYCKNKLEIHHDRMNYIVYVCQNKKCSYYKNNKKKVGTADEDSITTSSGQLNLRYHYREFKFNIDDLKNACESAKTDIDLSKIHFSDKVLGLILTYYVNYGLSARKTASILREVHGVKISHQTIINYASSVSKLIKPMVDNYPYKINSTLTGDETYIKVRGKNHYVFFFSDTLSKIITYYTIYENRDTFAACKAIQQSLRFYNGDLPEDLSIITDGNPIYNAAQLFFEQNNIKFTLHQVIGVKNKDDTSKQYRSFKQIEERLNRTYKQNYHGTNGYDTLEGANSYMVLYVAFFNFLRSHSSLNHKTPVDDGLFDNDMRMQDKWLKLIDLATQYI